MRRFWLSVARLYELPLPRRLLDLSYFQVYFSEFIALIYLKFSSFSVSLGTSNASFSWVQEIELCENMKMQIRVMDISQPFASGSDLQMGKDWDVSKLVRMFQFPMGFGHVRTDESGTILPHSCHYCLFFSNIFQLVEFHLKYTLQI